MYKITKTWNNKPFNHQPVVLNLSSINSPDSGSAVVVDIAAPFFNDPPKPHGGKYGESYDELWNFEVVETFFLNDNNEYIELEYGPYGQYLVLLINSKGNKSPGYEIRYECNVSGDGSQWTGRAVIPAGHFPPDVSRFNAYAIHGSGEERCYEALYPDTTDTHLQPNFHRLEFFQSIDFSTLLPDNVNPGSVSDEWNAAREKGAGEIRKEKI